MPNRESLTNREQALIDKSYSTAADFRTVAHYIRFPKSVSGQRILDIGSGASTAVLELRKRGAKALGLDPRYRDLDELRESVERFITDPSSSARSQNSKMDEEIRSVMEKEIPSGADPTLWKMALQMVQQQEAMGNRAYLDLQKTQLETFLSPDSEKPYIAGTATALPFKDNSFDFVYSLQAISQFLITDSQIFLKSIEEALRVLRRGSQLQLHPWYWPGIGIPQIEVIGKVLHTRLDRAKTRYKIEPASPFGAPRLVIFKNR